MIYACSETGASAFKYAISICHIHMPYPYASLSLNKQSLMKYLGTLGSRLWDRSPSIKHQASSIKHQASSIKHDGSPAPSARIEFTECGETERQRLDSSSS